MAIRPRRKKTSFVPRVVFTVAVASVVPVLVAGLGCGDDTVVGVAAGGFAGVAAVAMGGFGGVAAVAMGGFGGTGGEGGFLGVAAVAMGGFGGAGGAGGAGGTGGDGGQAFLGDPAPTRLDALGVEAFRKSSTHTRRSAARIDKTGRRRG